jgi:hypothetical protein
MSIQDLLRGITSFIILHLLGHEGAGIDWIDLDQGRDQWKALLNTVMNRRAPQNCRISFVPP